MPSRNDMDLDAILALTEAQRGYIAGFFDGEGYCGVHDKQRRHPTFRVTITQNRPAVLDWLCSLFGGSINPVSSLSKTTNGNEYRQSSWSWTINGTELPRFFIKFVLPHLIVKKDEALELLYIMENRELLSADELSAHYTQLSALKRVGGAALVVNNDG